MKKFFLLFTLALAVIACENPFSNTPDEDTTMLWPAGDSTGYWGFINEKGEMVIPAKYDRTYGFSGGMAQVYIDVDGKPLPSYMGYETSVMSSKHALINKRGEILFTLPEDKGFYDHYFYYGCCRFGGLRSRGMMNNNFNPFIPDDKYHEGIRLGVMTKDGLASSVLGYFNKSGELVISSFINGVDGNMYDRWGDFCDGIAVVEDYIDVADMNTTYQRYGALNTKGEVVIDTVYTFLQSVGCNRLVYHGKDGDYDLLGLMDTQGNIITEPFIHRDGYSFFGDGGLMPVYDFKTGEGRRYGYIDPNGNLQIPYQYEYAEPFCNGYAWVYTHDENGFTVYKLIDLQGQVILELDKTQYPAGNISGGYRNGLCLIAVRNQVSYFYQYINLQGEVVYSWPMNPNTPDSSVPEKLDPSSFDYDEMLLRLFEGTNYYPLAEQSLRTRKLNN